MKTIKTILLLPILILLSGCLEKDPALHDSQITIYNKSNKLIVYAGVIRSFDAGDTLLPKNRSFFNEIKSEYIIYPDSFTLDRFSAEAVKELLDKNNVEMYYLFDKDTLDRYSWEEIAEGYKVLKRVEFKKWEDYENCDFTITYP